MPTPSPGLSSNKKPMGLGGFKVPALDLDKAAEYNAANPEKADEAGIEWAETDADIKPEDADIINNSFNDLYAQNQDLRSMVQEAFETNLSLIQKYQILELFMDSEETPRG